MDNYAVFGNPIKQSKSPFIHTLFAQQTQEKIVYSAIEPATDDFKTALKDFFLEQGKGCNITAPFKEQAYQYAQQLTERAALAGAVNTLKLTDDGIIIGDNTDGAGLVLDLKNNNVTLKGSRILLIGAGGAARGVCGPLLAEHPKELIIANRTFSKAQTLTTIFTKLGNISACEFSELSGEFDLIINSTSASLHGEVPLIGTKLIRPETTIYDMMYSAQVTPFNAWAKEQGAKFILDGLGMLVGQAAESFAIWRGVKPDAKQVLNELRHHLAT
ncbi:shikimate dehydrogenase [Psychromonas ingrahamii 37]|uniref:Shikimate dehydrogenase (NADP(+)) n=1 Tax=Psychromonas ingrahamii (strain DSM 17664 / CCUG 51855 / 37) TaxID=357804 RepID=AROE_PSYIN|nr:shikimate dehydrogenase [Psychromonas ingrahamii]A1SR30.1 RecName: Full=Shikimate dehydrogenase (NADP(+)); Short=SDH [Psychromonas ingrahamii 37]ABM01945.1 shikimate dehydrogenase [Psychromonas ingrahamii 37]